MTIPDIYIEELARAWASIDGKAELFDKGKSDPNYEKTGGYYEGYLEEARELLRRSPSVLAALSTEFISVGGVGEMPGSNGGLTMSAFKASDVPLDATLYIAKARKDTP